jgi:hypothetical protein
MKPDKNTQVLQRNLLHLQGRIEAAGFSEIFVSVYSHMLSHPSGHIHCYKHDFFQFLESHLSEDSLKWQIQDPVIQLHTSLHACTIMPIRHEMYGTALRLVRRARNAWSGNYLSDEVKVR